MSERLTAIVRVRRSEKRELESPEEEVQLTISPDRKSISLTPAPPTSAAPFTVDSVFSPEEEDRVVYRGGLRKAVEAALLGYNATLLFTEVGGDGETLRDTIGRATEQIFACLRKSRGTRSTGNLVVNCSFLALAAERAYDLLQGHPGSGAGDMVPLSLTEEGLGMEASLHEAGSTERVFELLRHGQSMEEKLVETLGGGRRYHHTILSLTVEYSGFGSMNAPVSGTLSFVRLASLLPLARPQLPLARPQLPLARPQLAPDDRDDKHTSLFALAEVVESLQSKNSENDGKLYSKSLLTGLLRDAVGGNCKTVFVCEIAQPLHTSSLAEVGAALQLTSRARLVSNRPNKRDLAERALMSAYMKQLRKQYSNWGEGERGDDNPSTTAEERHREVEQAASALAQAVGSGEREEEEEERERDLSGSRSDRIVVVGPMSKKKQRKKTVGEGREGEGEVSGVTIDALVGVLQDPDRGVPRALETRLKDVKIRRDVGALFSGAGIVRWMVENVEGVECESDAVTLGQLLLDKGAIFHSEGSTVFANADSLFYYAREARLGKRLLSQEEIQALLSQTRDSSSHTHVTSVSVSQRGSGETRETGEGGDIGERGEGGETRESGDGESLGFGSPTLGGDGGEWGEAGLQISGGFKYTHNVEEKLTEPNQASEVEMEPPEDHSGTYGGQGEGPTGSHTSVESWMANDGTEEVEEGEEGERDEGRPSTSLQHNIPSIHTLENSHDYPHPLHMAVAIGKSPGVIKNLVMMFGVDQTDDQGRTPLMFAALGNKRASCSTLIECGAVCDRQDASGLTALHVACYHGSREAARVLLTKKASVATADKMGHTSYHWSVVPESPACLQLLLHYTWPSVLKQADSSGLTAMHWAIFYNRPQHLKLLLKKCAGEVEMDSSGRTLLTYAIERDPPTPQCITGLLEMCPQLLGQRDTSSRLPHHLASIAASPVPLSLLVTHRPPRSGPPLEVNCLDPLLRTPLHYSAAAHQLTNTQVLLSAGADRNMVDSEGRTALEYASLLEGGEEMVALLQDPTFSTTPSDDRRPATAATVAPPTSLTSESTHSLPLPTSSAHPHQHNTADDPSKVCTIL